MTTPAQWFAGARPRTLGAAVAPVLVGTAAAYAEVDDVIWWRAFAALVVALALQVGVNYANDYSDGVRGTDDVRAGPLRLTASKVATPTAVRTAAVFAFGVAAVVGAFLAVAVDLRLLVVGAAAIAAGALYTGGPRPYGYSGFGELAVLVFFGLVATAGSAYVQIEHVPAAAWWGAIGVGLLACAILLANNIRDIDGDRAVGKRTLAVRLGPPPTRGLYGACLAVAFGVVVVVAAVSTAWALLALLALPLAMRPFWLVLTHDDPPSLVAALVGTARLELVYAALLALGLALS
ncbi:MAG: 1,4-dihydroxy-2-naphthoate polyprenyltransferase [Actinobacteria bacterium]|nr:1,4-dihydroxy-2-naphthoate polyprenyltransferase [Actinomycetota bacterium]